MVFSRIASALQKVRGLPQQIRAIPGRRREDRAILSEYHLLKTGRAPRWAAEDFKALKAVGLDAGRARGYLVAKEKNPDAVAEEPGTPQKIAGLHEAGVLPAHSGELFSAGFRTFGVILAIQNELRLGGKGSLSDARVRERIARMLRDPGTTYDYDVVKRLREERAAKGS